MLSDARKYLFTLGNLFNNLLSANDLRYSRSVALHFALNRIFITDFVNLPQYFAMMKDGAGI